MRGVYRYRYASHATAKSTLINSTAMPVASTGSGPIGASAVSGIIKVCYTTTC